VLVWGSISGRGRQFIFSTTSSGGIVTKLRVRFSAGVRDFSLLHSAETGSGADPASYSMGTKGKAARE
jgi:hypothetical protein